MDSFEDVGLAVAVLSYKDIDAGREIDRRVFEVSVLCA
jgi:hypothetical protein